MALISARGAADPSGIAMGISRGVAFLAKSQLPDGSFRCYTSTAPDMSGSCVEDASVFPCALAANCLAVVAGAAPLHARLLEFLLAQMDPVGLWRHWTREHPAFAQLPPDLDDTGCASAALQRAGRRFPDNRALLLANRNRSGLFYTWFVPRPRLTPLPHLRVTLPQLKHALALWMFFRKTSAAPRDVDAVVNANALFYLGRGAHAAAVEAHLLAILRSGRESQCDKWYENPFAVWYFFSRALGTKYAEAAATMGSRLAAAVAETELDAALAISTLANLGRAAPSALVGRLLESQLPSGAWPKAALYHGGRARRKDGSYARPHPDTPRWGSEELTTAFCLEALSRVAPAAGAGDSLPAAAGRDAGDSSGE